ncbi:class I SAM-dependent methyltransferase [Bradyrhizobium elkanii]|uniref:Ubiquinone/menaquinone biosynthesis C-methylase UbiE n=1 Tax=Bradyrhizobium elkanii TaxID=29448 RepID=A0ABV4FAC4_BRAEL|nr:ubiquinone/menaquinone biosynthesis C-methylase UbiE [Bradyrhizobium elkanii]MCP1977761.1 ubiquinone/menaquinone biosynthesis C-methylase UbiE [Bradyrhizobium elkanii]MCS3887722.1 ubiquinone/menaquinone biosynthesis C-methylase UbiE [Bradyrhizobium elkanii]MCS4213259.1 ubiquinone/menaquinone biosynthesis C-methylase UbiE [Bradyrhizobium elkanii]MCW2213566.1 ubiquinone/menaquinone biosynthesis C-methylase UbiE [Bradyrhizobium elkanii]
MTISGANARRARAASTRRSEEAYDIVADHYDEWSWQKFWRENEFPLLLSLIKSSPPTRAVLDLGIGTGAFLSYALPHLSPSIRLVGVDISAHMLEHAQVRLGSRATLVRGDVQTGLPFEDGSFDLVLMMRVANHLRHFGKALCEVSRVLSPGGKLIATDLAVEFDYDCTRIPTPKATVEIETYKHSEHDWRNALRSASFGDIEFCQYGPTDVRNAFAGQLAHKFPQGNVPIFSVVQAIKDGRAQTSRLRGAASSKSLWHDRVGH